MKVQTEPIPPVSGRVEEAYEQYKNSAKLAQADY